jgi:hypothetical protein
MITWFDAYVQLYSVDPVRIERALKGYDGTDIDQVWRSVRKDVDRINELPEEDDAIAKKIRAAARARNISILMTIATFAFLLIFLSFTNQISAFGGKYLVIIAPGVVIALMYGALMLNTLSTRRLNKGMRTFYDDHAQELRKQTGHIKEATQLLIDKLQREIYAQDLDQDKFKFELYNQNYKNIVVVGKRRGRMISTVKPKNRS